MAMADSAEKPGIEEKYQTAGNTSNLTVEADRPGSADILIAAGWSESRVGMALLRLNSEWDAAAKPRRPGKEVIEVIAARIKSQDAIDRATAQRIGAPYQQPTDSANVRAHAESDRWFSCELRLLAQSLKSRPTVWIQLERWTTINRIDPEITAAALLHWLDPTCRICEGHGLHKVPGQPALSARQCNKCHGTGHVTYPRGAAKVLGYLEDCVNKARQSLKNRLTMR